MTRDEAKRRIECCRNFLANNYSDMGEPNFTAFNMAIKALEQQPCNDCISRKEAIDELKHQADNMYCWSGRYNEQRKGILIAINIISDLSSVTPQPKEESQPKTGHWIGHRWVDGKEEEYIVPIENGAVRESCICSECKEWLVGSDEYGCGGNYCPSCGAKMESETKE